MSFKREGDDGSQLNVLKKRRVADLLASFIPEDEAILLKNGRYACTVCFHRPVFDTLDMLTVHRRGKKHVTSLQKHYGKKHEHQNQLQKRQHQDFVRAEESDGQLACPAPLLAQTRKITHHALLKATPYSSCCARNRVEGSGPNVGWSEPFLSASTSCESQGSNPADERSEERAMVETTAIQSLPGGKSASPGCLEKRPHKTKKKSQEKAAQPPATAEAEDVDRLRAMEHYLQLRSSGWIPDGTGKWVKDDSVEFDSDEEEPPALQPPVPQLPEHGMDQKSSGPSRPPEAAGSSLPRTQQRSNTIDFRLQRTMGRGTIRFSHRSSLRKTRDR